MSAPREFGIHSPLEPGITLLEASAGTGKTYQITNLVLRLVTQAEPPVRMGQLLVVTFTKAATSELVDRIRSRIAVAVRAYRACVGVSDIDAALAAAKADPNLADLVRLAVERDRLTTELGLLVRAQEEFDQALISTIHGFCQRMLKQNAFESLVDFRLELVQDQSDLLEEIVDDFLSADVNSAPAERYAFLMDDCGFGRGELLSLAQDAVRDPRMAVDPDPEQALQPRPERLLAFADWWEGTGLAELSAAMDAAYAAGELVGSWDKKKGVRRAKQSVYVSKKCLVNGATLLSWVRSLIAGEDPGGLPQKDYWSDKKIEAYSPGPQAWHHPHLDRVRRVVQPVNLDIDHERALFVAYVRREVELRHRARRTMNFQDLLRLLAERLEDPQHAAALRGAIAPAFRAALIDEFQDTDPEQWTIFHTLFGGGGHHLYLIGDPKQAIYGFRGANVNVYLQAKGVAGERVYTMRTNYRSDARFLAALNPLLAAPQPHDASPDPALAASGMFALGGIAYEPVGAPPDRDPAVRLMAPPERLGDQDPAMAPLSLRFLDERSQAGWVDDGDPPQKLGTGVAQSMLAPRVAADIVELLGQGLRLHSHGAWRELCPGDIAVLVRKTRQARAIQVALLEAGVPCVLPGADSVLNTDEAGDLQLWLQAVQSPGADSTARAAITTPMFAVTAAQLRSLDDDNPGADHSWWDRWLAQLSSWQATLQKHGVLRAFRAAMVDRRVRTNLLAWPDGERRLTNLLHLLELLHAAQVQDHLQLAGLIRWLGDQRRRAQIDAETGELRLERDDAAVRILTMHKAKGLQFPVVFAPYLWGGTLGGRGALIVSERTGSPARVMDVRKDRTVEPTRSRVFRRERESRQEELRLLYVALTRAEQRCVVYTGHIKGLVGSALGTVLHAFPPGTPPSAVGDRLHAANDRIDGLTSDELWADLRALATAVGSTPALGPLVHVSRCAPLVQTPRWQHRDPTGRTVDHLAARVFRRRDSDDRPKGLDHTWKRTSYTSITKSRSHADDAALEAAEGLGVVSELQAAAKDHDQEVGLEALEGAGLDPAAEAALRAAAPGGPVADATVPLAEFPAGADAGTFLHELFEHLDFSAFAYEPNDLEGHARAQQELLRVVAERGPLHGFDSPRWRELLQEGLLRVLRTPLGGELGDLRLADIPRQRRLDELVFDLPIAGGDDHRRPDADGAVRFTDRVSGVEFGQAFLLGRGDAVLRDVYLQKLARGWTEQRFAGYLTGSIDLVFATPTDPEQPAERFYVLDYKSNRLDLLRERATPRAHFCQRWMLHEMEHHDYVVQAHLYTLALHRYLRQRVSGYDPTRHLGGALYLFVRGMAGPERPPGSQHPYGVFFLRPRLEVIQRLDQLFRAVPTDGGDV